VNYRNLYRENPWCRPGKADRRTAPRGRPGLESGPGAPWNRARRPWRKLVEVALELGRERQPEATPSRCRDTCEYEDASAHTLSAC